MPTSLPVRKSRHRKVRNELCAKLENNSRSRHARETKIVPECALDIPAPENELFRVAEGKLYTGNEQQVGLLRRLLNINSNGIFVHTAVNETKTK